MNERIANIDPSLRLRYELTIPMVLNSARAKRRLTVLITKPELDEAASNALAQIQLANWYCDDLLEDVDLEIVLAVPGNATVTRAVFERYGVEYVVVDDVDESDVRSITELALGLDADIVLSTDDKLRVLLIDDVMLLVDNVDGVLHNVEIHLKGFDVPWSFEYPVKMQPWTTFYAMCEPSIFKQLLVEWAASAACSKEAENKMRILVGHTLPAMCFNRDRMEFYRQQDRWTERKKIERQDFRFEYTNALNNFYVTMYSAVDLIAALCVDVFGLNVPKEQVYAISGIFPKSRRVVPGLDAAFSDKDFWEMYKLPRLIRHEAAHSGPVTPQVVYTGNDEFTDEQLDKAANEHNLYDDLHVLERNAALPDAIRTDIIKMVRFKAKLILLGRPLKHVILLEDGKKAWFYNPGPSEDLKRFLAFFNRVLAMIKPWGGPHPAQGGTNSQV